MTPLSSTLALAEVTPVYFIIYLLISSAFPPWKDGTGLGWWLLITLLHSLHSWHQTLSSKCRNHNVSFSWSSALQLGNVWKCRFRRRSVQFCFAACGRSIDPPAGCFSRSLAAAAAAACRVNSIVSTNQWLPPSVWAVTSHSVGDFPPFLKDAG